jgi:hypothetical protein
MKDYLKTMRQQAVQQQMQQAPSAQDLFKDNMKQIQEDLIKAGALNYEDILVNGTARQPNKLNQENKNAFFNNCDGCFNQETLDALKKAVDKTLVTGAQKDYFETVLNAAKKIIEDYSKDAANVGKVEITIGNSIPLLDNNTSLYATVNEAREKYDNDLNKTEAKQQSKDITYSENIYTKDKSGIKISDYASLLKSFESGYPTKVNDLIEVLADSAARDENGSKDKADYKARFDKYKEVFTANKADVIKSFASEVGLGAILVSIDKTQGQDAASIDKVKENSAKLFEKDGKIVVGGIEISNANIRKVLDGKNPNLFGLFDDEEEVKKAAKKVVEDKDNGVKDKRDFLQKIVDNNPDSEIAQILSILKDIFPGIFPKEKSENAGQNVVDGSGTTPAASGSNQNGNGANTASPTNAANTPKTPVEQTIHALLPESKGEGVTTGYHLTYSEYNDEIRQGLEAYKAGENVKSPAAIAYISNLEKVIAKDALKSHSTVTKATIYELAKEGLVSMEQNVEALEKGNALIPEKLQEQYESIARITKIEGFGEANAEDRRKFNDVLEIKYSKEKLTVNSHKNQRPELKDKEITRALGYDANDVASSYDYGLEGKESKALDDVLKVIKDRKLKENPVVMDAFGKLQDFLAQEGDQLGNNKDIKKYNRKVDDFAQILSDEFNKLPDHVHEQVADLGRLLKFKDQDNNISNEAENGRRAEIDAKVESETKQQGYKDQYRTAAGESQLNEVKDANHENLEQTEQKLSKREKGLQSKYERKMENLGR